MNITPYVKIARFDHWFKNVFMIPGVIVALYVQPELLNAAVIVKLVVALLATGFVASSNYVINEVLDAPFDALHPVKKNRPIPSGGVNTKVVYAEWIFLAVLGLSLAALLLKVVALQDWMFPLVPSTSLSAVWRNLPDKRFCNNAV